MNIFIYFLNTFFNLFYGVFIPIIPLLNEKYTGLAFSLYGVAKIISYYSFGKLVDGDKMRSTLYITLFLIFLVPLFYLLWPTKPYLAKFVEGIAFAGGTVFCFAFMTILSKRKQDFEKQLKIIMVLSSLGSVFGPALGYYFIKTDLPMATYLFIGFAFIINIIGLQFYKPLGTLKQDASTCTFDDSRANSLNKNLVVSILLLKGIMIGIQPCIAWWCEELFQFGPVLSGLAYLFSSFAFVIGSIRPRFGNNYIPFIAVIFLELAFFKNPHFFWPGNILLSMWLGQSMVKCMIELGWVTTDKTGKLNSLWLIISDIPIVFTPSIFWALRQKEMIWGREAFLILVMVGAIIFIKRHLQLKSDMLH